MKIALFHNLPPGGALRALFDQMRCLKKRGHRLFLYTFSTAEHRFFPVRQAADETHVEPLSFQGRSALRRYQAASRRLAERINASDAEAVFVSKCRFLGSPPVLQHLKKPHLFYSQEPLRIFEYEKLISRPGSNGRPYPEFWSLSAREKILKVLRWVDRQRIKREDRRSLEAARRLMTNSRFSARWFRQAYGREPEVNYLGVDSDFFSPAEYPKRESFMLSVGRLTYAKGHDFLIRAMGLIRPERRLPLVIACDTAKPRVQRDLEDLARRKGVALDIREKIGDEELRTLYQTARLVLCASHNEPFGLVPLEAMACQTPVLAVREGGYEESVEDGQNGHLLERNESAWADKLEECLRDPERLEAMGREGRRIVLQKWQWDAFGARLEEALKNL